MAHNPISLDLLRALDAIDQRGSFAAAASALHKVPSALTYTIQKVEQDLGIELFDRSGHRAKLTPAGKLVLDQGRLILRDINALAFSAQQLAKGWEPEVTLCIDTLFDANRCFASVQRFNELFPFVRVNIVQGTLSGTWEQLLNQRAHLIITNETSDPQIEGYQKATLGEISMRFCVSNNHPLAEHPNEVSTEMIDAYPIIVVPDSSSRFTPLTVGWTRQNRVIRVPTMTEKIAAQKAGLGVGYLPEHRIQAELAEGSLVPVAIPSNADRAIIAWRRGTAGPATQWFLDHLSASDIGLSSPQA